METKYNLRNIISLVVGIVLLLLPKFTSILFGLSKMIFSIWNNIAGASMVAELLFYLGVGLVVAILMKPKSYTMFVSVLGIILFISLLTTGISSAVATTIYFVIFGSVGYLLGRKIQF